MRVSAALLVAGALLLDSAAAFPFWKKHCSQRIDAHDAVASLEYTKPSVDEAAVQVRELVFKESLADLNTVFQDGQLAGSAIGLLEYYADCDGDGSLTLLMVEVGHTFKNWKAGSPVSLSIRRTPRFGRSLSPASEPRASLKGSLSFIAEDDKKAITHAGHCFVSRHPDAKAWLPGNKVHKTAFMKFDVESVYWLGGFGNVAYIGDIPVALYKNATVKHPKFKIPHFGHKHDDNDDDDDDDDDEKSEIHKENHHGKTRKHKQHKYKSHHYKQKHHKQKHDQAQKQEEAEQKQHENIDWLFRVQQLFRFYRESEE
ncbi:pyridoxamine 5'-phosphate oxidase-domain-containing protein [Lipomyces kononenkoae]|uniref:Pyridoxamine 5'-phosphate oxidase-domain-containing protein n=1 Tax=Lipomyces kononenkoae TaxID=34357 RepID=A0ACC3TCB5_LIPKO